MVQVPWARKGSGFTLLFEAMSMALIENEMPVNKAARILNEYPQRIWNIFNYWISIAYNADDQSAVQRVCIDETSTYADPKDLSDNAQAAQVIAQQIPKTDIKIRPHVDGWTGVGKSGSSNPEFLINGKYADLKRVLSIERLEKTFKKAMEQGNQMLVFKVEGDISIPAIQVLLKGQMKINNYPFERMFIVKEGKVYEYDGK